jgi:uncharacterized membrane protein
VNTLIPVWYPPTPPSKMASLSQAKILGGIGSILVLLGGLGSLALPFLGAGLPIVGLILTLVAVKFISDVVQDSSIFRNIIIGLGVAIIGSIVLGVFLVEAILSSFGSLTGLRSSLSTATTITGVPSIPTSVIHFAEVVIAGFAILWILLVVSAIFVRRSYNSVSSRLNVGLFRTAALIYLIGAALTIIFVGLIIVLIAQILLIIAFFSIPETLGVAPTTTYYPPPSTMQPGPGVPINQPLSSGRTCPRCGAPVAQDAVFCPSCGSSLAQ